MSNVADVVIIGGGVNGCAAAYYLAKSGIKSVIVLEATNSIGHGGSSRNGGGVRQSGRDVRELPYAMYGIQNTVADIVRRTRSRYRVYPERKSQNGKNSGAYEKTGSSCKLRKSVGLDVRMVDQKEVKEICPYLSDDVIGASWCPTDGHANPLTTTLGYYKRALELGVKFYTEAPVKSLQKIKGKVRKVILNDGTVFEGETIILVAGYESRAIARTVGVDVPMTRLIDECLVTEMQPHMIDVMFGCASADFYGHQTKHGSFVFGSDSGWETVDEMIDPSTNIADPSRMITNSMTLSASCRAIQGYIPALRDAKIVRSWCGWLDEAFDGVPFLSPVEEAPGLILACGFTGHGFGTAPAVGLMLSQMVRGEKTVVDISALRYDRFKPCR